MATTRESLEDDDRILATFTARMEAIAQRREGKAEKRRAAQAALDASLRVAGWLYSAQTARSGT